MCAYIYIVIIIFFSNLPLFQTLVKAVIMLRNKDLVSATAVLQLFFKLLRCEDKLLRKTIYQYVVSDIKNINSKHKNARLNSALQTYMFTMLQENNGVTVKTALDIMIELYKRNIWNDAKTVNVITTACFSKITKVMVAAIKFFLGKLKLVETLNVLFCTEYKSTFSFSPSEFYDALPCFDI